MKIDLAVSAGVVNNKGPCVEVLINKSLVYDFVLNEDNTINLEFDNNIDNTVTLLHKNKTNNDTVIQNGNIVADKFLIVNKIWVDDILLPDFFKYTNRAIFYPENYTGPIDNYALANCLYFNGTLSYKLNKNFFMWLHLLLKKLDQQHADLHQDPEAEQKFFGYNQESPVEQELIDLLDSRGYSITN